MCHGPLLFQLIRQIHPPIHDNVNIDNELFSDCKIVQYRPRVNWLIACLITNLLAHFLSCLIFSEWKIPKLKDNNNNIGHGTSSTSYDHSTHLQRTAAMEKDGSVLISEDDYVLWRHPTDTISSHLSSALRARQTNPIVPPAGTIWAQQWHAGGWIWTELRARHSAFWRRREPAA